MQKQPDPPQLTWPPVEMVVSGELACFTRPEMKVERVSYPVITPSAARGVLEAVFWAPDVIWKVREIWILKPPRWFSIVRSESFTRQSALQALNAWSKSDGHYFIRAHSTFRHTLALRDVEYLLRADVYTESGLPSRAAAIRAQFRRRVARGACFHHPYLGCREFVASFRPAGGNEAPIPWNECLGPMLLDMEYGAPQSAPSACFFDAEVRNGILRVPNRAGVLS